MRTLRCVPLLVLLFIAPAFTPAGELERIAGLIKQGNGHELAKNFAANVDISIQDNANTYSKAQAEIIVEKFFKDNKPSAIKMLHKVNSSAAYNFAVLILTTDKGKYRVAYTLKEVGKEMVLIELRIESEKT